MNTTVTVPSSWGLRLRARLAQHVFFLAAGAVCLCVANLGRATDLPVTGNVTVTGDVLLGTGVSGQTAAPAKIDLGLTYSNGTTRDKLKIYLYNNNSTEQYGFGVGSIGDIQYHSNAIHDFYINNSPMMRINSTGVGIGTNAPINKLSVVGELGIDAGYKIRSISGTNNDLNYIEPYDINGGMNFYTRYGIGNTAQGAFRFYTANATSPTLAINSAGNVGIGTPGPVSRLTLAGGGNANPNTGSEVDYGGQNLTFQGVNTAGTFTLGGIKMVQPNGVYVDSADMVFSTAGGGALPERMRISRLGNVGIGATAPNSRLVVQRDGAGSQQVLSVVDATSNGSPYIKIGKTDLTIDPDTGLALMYDSASNYGALFLFGDNPGSQGIVLKRNGLVGIGTAAPGAPLDVRTGNVTAGSQTFNAIQVGPASGTAQFGNGASILLDSFTNHNGGLVHPVAGLWSSLVSGGGSSTTDYAGSLVFGTKNAGDSAPTERMRIDNAGNVGIGTTNPGTYKLAVNGTIRATLVIVEPNNLPDYVFEKGYRNAPLSEVEAHIQQYKHLPDVPSAAEVAEKGLDIGTMQSVLLRKIEELTLHMIAQEKQMTAQGNHMTEQEKRIERLERENAALRAATP